MGNPAKRPVLSVVMANYNGAKHLAAAMRSVLAQSFTDLELIVADDASSDESLAIARAIAVDDRRVVLLEAAANRGPAATRNAALAAAQGDWIGVVDSDDLIHPDRFEKLIAQAIYDEADIIADDLMVFHDDGSAAPAPLLTGTWASGPRWINLADYVRQNRLNGSGPSLGYLKPVIRRASLEALDIGYDPTLRIAEDFDLVARLLAAGARFRLTTDLTYFYRKYAGSISHRLSVAPLQSMLAAHERMALEAAAYPSVRQAARARRRSLHTAIAFEHLVAALKARRAFAALGAIAAAPSALRLLARAVREKAQRALRRSHAPASHAGRRVVFLSRQRITNAQSGSSAYLLAAARAFARQGDRLTFVGVSSAAFGRTPWMRLGQETDIFNTMTINGAVALGRWRITLSPSVWRGALVGAVDRLALRLGLIRRSFAKPAPYSVSVPLTRQDRLFVARAVAGRADVVVADYAYLTEALPYALAPEALTAVLVHDVFSERKAQFQGLGQEDSVSDLDPEAEERMLGQADVVVAIQNDETKALAQRMPQATIVTAPFPTELEPAAQPGQDDIVLFIGSDTAPNVDGLTWFLAEVWPMVLAARPKAQLRVIGGVCARLADPPPGVVRLGRVADLGPDYAQAGVVISPLRAGSGLKIKLIEALGRGKAVVCTSTTLQGVRAETNGAVVEADAAQDMGAAIVELLGDPSGRAVLGGRALAAAARHFGVDACFAPLINAARRAASETWTQPQSRARHV